MVAPRADELPDVLTFVAEESRRYLDGIDERPVRDHDADEVALRFGGSLSEQGVGALEALAELAAGFDGAVRSASSIS
jgi:hypothetical protein